MAYFVIERTLIRNEIEYVKVFPNLWFAERPSNDHWVRILFYQAIMDPYLWPQTTFIRLTLSTTISINIFQNRLKERDYIERSLSPPRKQRSGKELMSIYIRLLKSGGTWVYIFGMIGSSFLFYLVLNLCPKYFKERLNLDLEQAGFLAWVAPKNCEP